LTSPGSGDSEGRIDDSDLPGVNGQFLKVLKCFLNLIWEPVLEEYGRVDDMQDIQDLTATILLKNPAILKDVWQ